MSRSIKKGPFVHPKLLKKVEGMNAKGVSHRSSTQETSCGRFCVPCPDR